ncbi:type IV secretion system protein [Cupriavidus necator]
MPATPNIQIHIFTTLFDAFTNAVTATITTGSANVIALISPLMAAGFGIYVTLVMVLYWTGRTDQPIVDFFLKMVAWAAILTAGMNIGYYTSYVVPFFNGIGDDLAQALLGHGSSSVPAALDTLAGAYLNGVMQIYQDAGGFGETMTALLMIAVVVLLGGTFLAIAAAFLILAKFALGVLLALGPLFISAALFPATRKFFDAWAGQCLNYAFLVSLFAATAALELNFATSHVSTAFSWQGLMEMAVMGMVFIVIAFELPSLASALAGGVGISALVSGAVSRGVARGAMGAAKGAGAAAAGLGRGGARALRKGNSVSAGGQ